MFENDRFVFQNDRFLSVLQNDRFSVFQNDRFTVEMCSLDAAFVSASVGNRPQQTASVRNRLRVTVVGATWPCLFRFCQSGQFWRFQTSRSFVSRRRCGTL